LKRQAISEKYRRVKSYDRQRMAARKLGASEKLRAKTGIEAPVALCHPSNGLGPRDTSCTGESIFALLAEWLQSD